MERRPSVTQIVWLLQLVGGSAGGTAEGRGKVHEEEGERVVRSLG